MGDATVAMAEGVRTVVRNPVVVGVSAVAMVVLAPVVAVLGLLGLGLTVLLVGPLVFRLATSLVVKPLLLGSVTGVAATGFDGTAEWRDAVDALRDGFFSLAGAYLVHELALVAVFVVFSVLAVAAGLVGVAVQTAVPNGATIGMLLAGGAGAIVAVAIAVVLQFVDVAVVVGGLPAIEAVKESLAITREDPLGVLGYTVLRVVLVGAVLLPAGGFGLVVNQIVPGIGWDMWVGWAVGVLLLPVAFAAVTAAHVAYYRRRRPGVVS